jgi:CRISPR-associated protein Cas1
MQGHTEQEFRQACIESLTRSEALDFMIDTLKATAERFGRMAQADAVPAKA